MRKRQRELDARIVRKLPCRNRRRGRRILRGIRRIFTERGGQLVEVHLHWARDAMTFTGTVQGWREGTYLTAQEWVEWRGVPSRMIACAKEHLQVLS